MALFDFLTRRTNDKRLADQRQAAEAKRRMIRRASAHAARSLLQAGNTSRLEESWSTTAHSADALISRQWAGIAARARLAANEDPHGRKFIQLLQDNVAGPYGFTFSADVKDQDGVTTDMPASNALEAEYARFSRRGNFDVTGRLSRRQCERLWAAQLGAEGEAIAVIKIGAEAGPYGFAIQMVDPYFLDPQHNEVLQPGGNYIRHGIEFTRAGRPVRYYFREFDEQQIGYVTYSGQRYNVVDAEWVLHDFRPEMINQKRGLSQMRAALWRMRMLKGYEDAAVTNARAGASKMGFFRDPDGEIVDEDDLPMDAEPGTFQNIGGLEFQAFDPQYPNGEFAGFVQRCLMSLSSALGISYHNVASDLSGVNYTSSRTGELNDREFYKGVQEDVVEGFCLPLYWKWVEYVVLKGTIKISGRPLKFERLDRYKDAGKFTGRRWGWVDPQADIAAAEKAVDLGLSSRQSIMRENGKDPWGVWDEIEEERAEMESRGIPVDGPKRVQAEAAAEAAANAAKAGGKTPPK